MENITKLQVMLGVSKEHRRYIGKAFAKPNGKLATDKEVEEYVQLLFINNMEQWYQTQHTK